MIIRDMFADDINRKINGVIKVDQAADDVIEQELNEYVIDLKLLDRTTVNVTAGREIKFNIDWGDGTVDSNIQHTYTLKEGDSTQFTLKTKDILGQDLRKCCIAINKLLFVPLYDNDDPDAFDEDTENLFKGFIN